MMYKFIDTNQAQTGSPELPAEAMSFNGVCFERVIPGYRTLSVSGREGLETEIEELTAGASDGAQYQYRHDKTRTITVKFQLLSGSAEEMMDAFNALNGYLGTEQAQIIFNDEPDKFFIGTKSNLSDVEAGRTHTTGSIEIHCADPYKYSVREHEQTADSTGKIAFSYAGTYPAKPKIYVGMNAQTGFIGLWDNSQRSLIFGNTSVEKSASASWTSINVRDRKFTASELSGWTLNKASKTINTGSQDGTITSYAAHGENVVHMSSKVTTAGLTWCGASMTHLIGTDSSGATSTKNFEFYTRLAFIAGAVNQVGGLECLVTSQSGQNVAAIVFLKNNVSDTVAVSLYAAGNKLETFTLHIPASENINTQLGWASGQVSITRSGDVFSYEIGGIVRHYRVVTTLTAYSVSYYFFGLANFALPTYMDVRACGFRWDPGTSAEGFQNGSLLEVDTGTGEIKVNGIGNPGVGNIQNDWEGFEIEPGSNTISCACSSWTSAAPTYKIRYREVYR